MHFSLYKKIWFETLANTLDKSRKAPRTCGNEVILNALEM